MRTVLLSILLFLSISSDAQNYDIDQMTNEDGLSNSSITTLLQSSNGLMWFGTWDGLNMYNSREVKIFKPSPTDKTSISNNIIRDIIEESPHYLWIATDFGINRLNVENMTFERFFVNRRNGNSIVENSYLIAKNTKNQLFAYVYRDKIYYYDKDKNEFKPLTIDQDVIIKKMFFDKNDRLWIVTDENVLMKIEFNVYDRTPEIRTTVSHFDAFPENIQSVFYIEDKLVFQNAGHNVFVFDIETRSLKKYPAVPGTIKAITSTEHHYFLGTEEGLYISDKNLINSSLLIPKISVLSLCKGTQDIIWIGTDMQGVWRISPPKKQFQKFSKDTMGNFGENAVRTFMEDDRGVLWVGTKGEGIYLFSENPKTRELTLVKNITQSNGLNSDFVFKICKGTDEYWIGTDGEGLNYYDPAKEKIFTLSAPNPVAHNHTPRLNLSSVYAILPDSNTLWIGTNGYGMFRLDIDKSTRPYKIKSYKQYVYTNEPSCISNNNIFSIIRDDSAHLWIATRGGGLNRFHIQDETFESYRFSNDNKKSISSDDVLCLHKDHEGFLWAGTSMGLNKLVKNERGNAAFIRINESSGMPNNTIHGILEDSRHHLWISTNNGLAQLIRHGEQISNIISYFKEDGLQNNEFSDGAYYASPTSRNLYFGGISGFNRFNPSEIKEYTYMPTLWLDAFFVDNIARKVSDYLHKGKLTFSYGNKSFSFKFIPIDYVSGEKCEIAYILEDFQKDWINLGTSNTLVFTNIPKGTYLLKVKCSNANKIWSDNYFTIPVKINPPWWASNVAYAAYLFLFVLIIWLINRFMKYRFKVKEELKLKEMEQQKNEEIHEAKLRFFTNIAHEFSNSLTLIYAPCEQILRHPVTESIKKYVNTIKLNSERMQKLIQQLIEFRKAETGHLKIIVEKVDIVEIVKYALDLFLEMLEEKKISYTLICDPETIVWQTDRDSIEKIIINLLSNAVKYTPTEENIHISVKIAGNKLAMQVTNTGIGIKKEYQESIFDRFEVLNRFEKQVSVGLQSRSGIGLALCKSLVDILSGSIRVESDGISFTSFIVHIPELEFTSLSEESVYASGRILPSSYITGIEEKSIDSGNTPQTLSRKDITILVVEDDREIRSMLKDILGERYTILEAENGMKALEIVDSHSPTLIISDIIMPELDGVELVKKLKSQEQTAHIPIILLSSKNSIENQIEGIEVGADAYINKPFHPRHLMALIENMLRRMKTILDYADSPYVAMESFEGKIIHKEDYELMLHVTKIIADNIDNDELSVEFIAREIAISKMQLYRKIKEITDRTPMEYIRSVRLKHVEKLLITTNKTISEIMYMSGFNNKAYFHREFLKKYKITPKEYRLKNQERP